MYREVKLYKGQRLRTEKGKCTTVILRKRIGLNTVMLPAVVFTATGGDSAAKP
jgi:hypothetical protein